MKLIPWTWFKIIFEGVHIDSLPIFYAIFNVNYMYMKLLKGDVMFLYPLDVDYNDSPIYFWNPRDLGPWAQSPTGPNINQALVAILHLLNSIYYAIFGSNISSTYIDKNWFL